MSQIQVLILMGSDSDAPIMKGAADVLREFGITCEMTVASAHRSPARVQKLLAEAPARGVQVFIVGAGAAAHLAGMVAAHTTKPVIGVPIDSSPLLGLDALLVDRADAARRARRDRRRGQVGRDQRRRARRADPGRSAIPHLPARLEAYKAKLADKVEQAAARLAAGDGSSQLASGSRLGLAVRCLTERLAPSP